MNYAVDDELHKRLKLIAVVEGKTLKAVVIEALEEHADRYVISADGSVTARVKKR